MTITESLNKDALENFLGSINNIKIFTQSWNFGEFIKKQNQKIWRLGIYDRDNLIGACFAYKITARRSNFLYIPHGPIIKDEKNKVAILKTLKNELTEISKKENIDCIRINSLLEKTEQNSEIFKNLGFQKAPLFIFTENFWIIDISKSENDLLKSMRKVHRYSIKKSIRDGVAIKKVAGLEDLDSFYKIYLETAKRQKFTPYEYNFIKEEFDTFKENNGAEFFFAEYQNKILSSALIIYYSDSAYYHHGASLNLFPKIQASYLLHWEVIKEAQKRNLKFYNMWGVAPLNAKNHPWQGLTFFKTGFGGKLYECLPTQDLPLTKKYWLNYLVEKFRKFKKNLY